MLLMPEGPAFYSIELQMLGFQETKVLCVFFF